MEKSMKSERVKAHEKEKDELIRQIFRTQAEHARWQPQKDEFRSGDAMGFDLPGVSVRTVVTYDQYGVSVHMTSPADCTVSKDIYYRQQTFFRRNPRNASLTVDGTGNGPANDLCLETARNLVIGLYSDWAVTQSRKDVIRRKLKGLYSFTAVFMEKERERVAAVRDRIRELSFICGSIRRRFKAGELYQVEYIADKKSYRKEMEELHRQDVMRDPFVELFKEELSRCRFAKEGAETDRVPE